MEGGDWKIFDITPMAEQPPTKDQGQPRLPPSAADGQAAGGHHDTLNKLQTINIHRNVKAAELVKMMVFVSVAGF